MEAGSEFTLRLNACRTTCLCPLPLAAGRKSRSCKITKIDSLGVDTRGLLLAPRYSYSTSIRIMSTSRRPLFSLAPSLAIHTPASPISISQAWQKSYPAPQCPFTSTSATSSSTLPPFLNLSQGVPGQLPSAAFRARLQEEASKDLHHSYSLAAPALRQNLAKQINEVYRRGQDPEGRGAVGEHDICVTAGCNSASEFVFRMLCQPGANEAVVIPTPFVSLTGRVEAVAP